MGEESERSGGVGNRCQDVLYERRIKKKKKRKYPTEGESLSLSLGNFMTLSIIFQVLFPY